MSFFPPDALRCGVRVYWKAHLSPLCCGLPDHLVAVERVTTFATERRHKLLASAAFVLAPTWHPVPTMLCRLMLTLAVEGH